jgi:disulfide oxidoreductase YuzD
MINREALPFLKNILGLHNSDVNLNFLENVLTAIKNNKEFEDDIIDSFSKNQFTEKIKLIEHIKNLNILNENSEIIIFGSWYGSIFIPVLAPKVKRVTCIDLNDQVLKIAKNRLFQDYKNIDYIAADIFDKDRERYWNSTLFINTSCEHMPTMKEWPFWINVSKDAHFAFMSNNMDYIEGHINCVNSIEEFKNQLPNNFKVLFEDEIVEERGIKYLVVGKICH